MTLPTLRNALSLVSVVIVASACGPATAADQKPEPLIPPGARELRRGVQFSRDPEAVNQYFRQMAPNTGPFDVEVTSAAVAALFDRIGGCGRTP